MTDDDTIACERHGVQPLAYVCAHICAFPHGETIGFVSGAPDSGDDLRDAWCDACHAYLVAHGGEWVEDEVMVPGGIGILCAQCYRDREADAASAGRRRIHAPE